MNSTEPRVPTVVATDANVGCLDSAEVCDTTGWRVQCIQSHPSQAATTAEWNRLAGDEPFRSSVWAETWWRHCALGSTRPFVLTVRDATGELIGLAPWCVNTSLLQGRVIQFLGAGHICSDYLGLLAAAQHQSTVATLIGNWLANAGRETWDLLHLDGAVADDPGVQTLIDTLAARGHGIDQRRPQSTWRLTLPTTWAEFERQLSRTRRERTRQFCRIYFDTGRLVPRLVSTPAELAKYWPVFIDLHQRRRQSLGEAGCFATPSFTAFHTEMTAHFAATGQLRLHFVELDGKPVAADYSFTSGDTIYMYQTGFDPEYAGDTPGTLNLISTLKLAIEEGYRTFDFLRGDEVYKASWRAKPIVQWDVRIVGRRPGAVARYHGRQGVAGVQRLLSARWQALVARYHTKRSTPNGASLPTSKNAE